MQTGKQFFPPAMGNVALKDTSLFYSYMNNDVVKNTLPANVKFLFGVEEKAAKRQHNDSFHYMPLKQFPVVIKLRLKVKVLKKQTRILMKMESLPLKCK